MIYELTPELDHIFLYEKKWKLVQDGVEYWINPESDQIRYNDQVVELKPLHEVYLKLISYMKSLGFGRIPVVIHTQPHSVCTAYYIENLLTLEKTPLVVSMSADTALELDNWKMALAHEFYHYVIYKFNFCFNSEEVEQITSKKQTVSKVELFFIIISPIIICLSILFGINSLGFFFGMILGGLAVALTIKVQKDLIQLGHNFFNRCYHYFMEYECDKFAYNFFPEINLDKTFLNRPELKDIVFDSHPSDAQRIKHIKEGVKEFSFVFHHKNNVLSMVNEAYSEIKAMYSKVKPKGIKQWN